MSLRGWSAVLAVGFVLSACALPPAPPAPPQRLDLRPASFSDLPDWSRDRAAEALPAFLRSCRRLLAMPAEAAVGRNALAGRAADWRRPCELAALLPPGNDEAARLFFEVWFEPFRAAGDGLFTGYYESELRGSRQPRGPYRHPLYGRPADLVTVDLGRFLPELDGRSIVGRIEDGGLRPYPTQGEIQAGALDGAAPVLFWADDPIDVLLLHIQGSGRMALDDGGSVRLGYAASNGHGFVGIGRLLIERGKIARERASMQAVVAWLQSNPDEAAALIAENPRYIFFREVAGEGPLGAFGVPLTAGRSLAVDRAFVPLGIPLWLDTTEPGGAPLRRLVIAQDTGAAIKGPVRGDFFWGTGAPAFAQAGRMKSRGGYWLLLPRHRTHEGS